MTPQPTLMLTGTGNLQIYIPMHIRRMRGRKMIFAPQALDGDVPDAHRKCRRPWFRPWAGLSPSRTRLRAGSFTPFRI